MFIYSSKITPDCTLSAMIVDHIRHQQNTCLPLRRGVMWLHGNRVEQRRRSKGVKHKTRNEPLTCLFFDEMRPSWRLLNTEEEVKFKCQSHHAGIETIPILRLVLMLPLFKSIHLPLMRKKTRHTQIIFSLCFFSSFMFETLSENAIYTHKHTLL